MNFIARIFTMAALMVAFFCLCSCDSGKPKLRFGSGNEGGVYYKYANDFAQNVNGSKENLEIQTKRTAGSSANIRLLEEGYIDLGIAQADDLSDYHKRNRIRSSIVVLTPLFMESIQIVVAANSGISSVSDLMDRTVSLGEEESGSNRSAKIILEAYGIPLERIREENLSFMDAAKALSEGKIDAFFCTVGVPMPAISELAASMDIKVLSLDSLAMRRVVNLHPELTPSEIPAGTYAGQDSAVHTLGVQALLMANQSLDSATVEVLKRAARIKHVTQPLPGSETVKARLVI